MGKKTATFLQLLKETGMRPGEAWNLRWIDIDLENNSVTISPEKNSRSRRLGISRRLASMFHGLPQSYELIFRNPGVNTQRSLDDLSRNFSAHRGKLADKLQNPRIRCIGFKTLRHFKASMEYHRTKDILHFMQLLGHKNIKNTLVYTHLVDFGSDEYVCKVAKTVDDSKILIEDGFEYVADIEGMKLFRKRK